MTNLVRKSACELSRMIHAREISCQEVMFIYLEHIQAYNPIVNAIVSPINAEKCILAASTMDDRIAAGDEVGWMAGFPLAPKDLTHVAGIPTTFGASFLKNNKADNDSIIVERMRRAGAIMIGKTNVPEFGLGSQTYNQLFGVTKNPYDCSKTSGGSSGGTAAALATCMMPVADGSDLGGSLRNPAAWNNIYGFRPSISRVPFGPNKEVFLDQLTTEGPMGRHVEDVAMLLSIQAGYDSRVPTSMLGTGHQFADLTKLKSGCFKGCRIGWLGSYNGHVPIDPELLDLSEQAVQQFKVLGCIVDEVVPNFDMHKLWDSWCKLRSFLFANKIRVFYEIDNCRTALKSETIWEIEQGLKVSAASLYSASETRSAWVQELTRLLDTYDFLVLPSTQVKIYTHYAFVIITESSYKLLCLLGISI